MPRAAFCIEFQQNNECYQSIMDVEAVSPGFSDSWTNACLDPMRDGLPDGTTLQPSKGNTRQRYDLECMRYADCQVSQDGAVVGMRDSTSSIRILSRPAGIIAYRNTLTPLPSTVFLAVTARNAAMSENVTGRPSSRKKIPSLVDVGVTATCHRWG